MGEQMVFKRYEIKYMLTKGQRDLIQNRMRDHMTMDVHGKNTILSLYLDTPDFLLARRSMEHPMYKEKLRMRSYGVAGPDSTVFLELKKKYDSVVYKRRESMTEKQLEQYVKNHVPPKDTQIMRELAFAMGRYEGISPAVLLSYEREAFYAKEDSDFRITFDENILWRDYDVNLHSGVYGSSILAPGMVLMEVKTAGAIPMWLVKLFSEQHIYKTNFSKYGRAYEKIEKQQRNGGNYKYA